MSKARGLADLGNAYSDGALSNRNLIINGAMQVAQRGTSFTGISSGASTYTLDRFYSEFVSSAGATISATKSSDAPAGFNDSISIAVTTSGATSSGDYGYFRQNVEGYNSAHLNFGSSNAKTITLSFWVKSSLTGTFGGWFGAVNNTSFNIFSYTVNSANTWEYKTVTVSGDVSGTWNKTNQVGLQVAWSLVCGSTYQGATGSWGSSLLLGATGQINIGETSGATWQITGVQLEAGDTATPFEHRSYSDQLQSCMRYFQKTHQGDVGSPSGSIFSSSGVQGQTTTGMVNGYYVYPVQMRASPTTSYYDFNGTASKVTRYNPNVANNHNQTGGPAQIQPNMLLLNSTSGAAASQVAAHMELDAEL